MGDDDKRRGRFPDTTITPPATQPRRRNPPASFAPTTPLEWEARAGFLAQERDANAARVAELELDRERILVWIAALDDGWSPKEIVAAVRRGDYKPGGNL